MFLKQPRSEKVCTDVEIHAINGRCQSEWSEPLSTILNPIEKIRICGKTAGESLTTHIDAVVDRDDSERVDELLTAKVTKTDELGAIGVPIFLSADDLEKQGIDTESVEKIGIRVEDGFMLLVPIDPDEEAVGGQ